MKLEGDTVILKSVYKWFTLERSGEKPNTVRLMSGEELAALQRPKVTKVRIDCIDPCAISTYDTEAKQITRPISHIFDLGDILGQKLVMITWRPE